MAMQRVEDLPAPTDPWMIRLYEEHPDLARRLDQWCIDCAAAGGREFVRDATVRYAGSISCAEMHKMLDDLFWVDEEYWQPILKRHCLLSPSDIRLLEPFMYHRVIKSYPGLNERIKAYAKGCRRKHKHIYIDPEHPAPKRHTAGPGRGHKKRTGGAG